MTMDLPLLGTAMSHGRRLRIAGLATLVICSACGVDDPVIVQMEEEEEEEQDVSVTIEAITWPDTLGASETDTIEVTVKDPLGRAISGITLEWESSDDQVITVAKLADEQSAVVTAVGGGQATVTVSLDAAGFAATQFDQSLSVVQKWVLVTAGRRHTCGITLLGGSYCWGDQLEDGVSLGVGDGGAGPKLVPTRVGAGAQGQQSFVSMDAGEGYTCGLTGSPGSAYCWGRNPVGALGVELNALPVSQNAPIQPVTGGKSFLSIAAGGLTTCGIEPGGVGFCWGLRNLIGDGFLSDSGDGENMLRPSQAVVTETRPAPIRLSFGAEVSSGSLHACAVGTDALVYCWGSNLRLQSGTAFSFRCQLFVGGLERDKCRSIATPVDGIAGVASVSAGGAHTCAVSAQGAGYCWGDNEFGQLGATTDSTRQASPRMVAAPEGEWASISAGGRAAAASSEDEHNVGASHTCGLTSTAAIYCWGDNSFGQLGQAGTGPGGVSVERVVDPESGPVEWSMVSAGARHTCGITTHGLLYCWGVNFRGRLGNDTLALGEVRSVPLRISEPSN